MSYKTNIEVSALFLEEEDKSGWATSVEAEAMEGEPQCALHVQGTDIGPLCSVYLSPVDAAMLGTLLIQVARVASEVSKNAC